MNLEETTKVLAVAAAFDKRTVSETEAGAWHRALYDLPFEDSRLSVIRHYSESRDWIMPADIRKRAVEIDRIRRAQGHAAAQAAKGELPDPPTGPLTRDEIEAFRRKAKAHGIDPATFGNFNRAVASRTEAS